jgi:CBS domain-containing protein
MKVKEVMTQHPLCCSASDLAQKVAQIFRDEDIGAMPVVADGESKKLLGIVTDRDVCCHIVAEGLDPKSTTIEAFITRDPVTCRPEQSLDSCERLMQTHRIRRILVIDENACCVGILSQADLARSDDAQKVHRTVAEISKPSQTIVAGAIAV